MDVPHASAQAAALPRAGTELPWVLFGAGCIALLRDPRDPLQVDVLAAGWAAGSQRQDCSTGMRVHGPRLGAGALDRFLTEGTQGGFVHHTELSPCLCDDTKENQQSQHDGVWSR